MQGVLCTRKEFKWLPLHCMFLVTPLHDFGHSSHTHWASTVADFWCQRIKLSLLSHFTDINTILFLLKLVAKMKGKIQFTVLYNGQSNHYFTPNFCLLK